MRLVLPSVTLFCAVCAASAASAQWSNDYQIPDAAIPLEQRVQSALGTTPGYGVYDDLHFAMHGTAVVLEGSVTRPEVAEAARKSVANVRGVTAVENQVAVLPSSASDDALRKSVFANVYLSNKLLSLADGTPLDVQLQRAADDNGRRGPGPGYFAVHILVSGGHVTLVGVVDTPGDIAYAVQQAKSAAGNGAVESQLDSLEDDSLRTVPLDDKVSKHALKLPGSAEGLTRPLPTE